MLTTEQAPVFYRKPIGRPPRPVIMALLRSALIQNMKMMGYPPESIEEAVTSQQAWMTTSDEAIVCAGYLREIRAVNALPL